MIIIAEIADPASELVRRGLKRHCGICCVHTKGEVPVCRKGEPCVNTIKPGDPLPGRCIHFERALKPDNDREPDEKDGS